MGEQSQDKTEEPTPHKLREARKKGQVVKSKEVTTAFLVLVSYNVFRIYAPDMYSALENFCVYNYQFISEELNAQIFGLLLKEAQATFFRMLLPIFIAVFATAIIVESLQTQFNFSLEPLKPDLKKLNPVEGFKRMFSLKGIVELVKSLIKMGVVIWIMQKAISSDIDKILTVSELPLTAVLKLAGEIIMKVVTRVGIAYLFIALLDYFYQRHEYMKNMRMSKQEIKEEYKKLEGDPQVKQRMRQMQREAAMSRSMGNVPSADVVVTNPTHIAVAIKYDASSMTAPRVVAKGQRKTAEQIKSIAEEHLIPIVEKVELARALFSATEVGEDIPYDFYRAVAEVLAFVYDIRKKRRQGR